MEPNELETNVNAAVESAADTAADTAADAAGAAADAVAAESQTTGQTQAAEATTVQQPAGQGEGQEGADGTAQQGNGTAVQPDPAGEEQELKQIDPCSGGGGYTGIIWLGALVILMYLLFWRPQQKQAKRRKEMLTHIKKNDRVVTIGGIYGIVYSINDDEVTLKIDERNDVRIKVSRGAISRITTGEEAADDTGATIEPQ